MSGHFRAEHVLPAHPPFRNIAHGRTKITVLLISDQG